MEKVMDVFCQIVVTWCVLGVLWLGIEAATGKVTERMWGVQNGTQQESALLR